MDFSSLINHEIEARQRDAGESTRRRRSRKRCSSTTEEEKPNDGDNDESLTAPSAPSAPDAAPALAPTDLLDIPREPQLIDEQLQVFGEDPTGLSEATKIDRLHYLVRQEKYKQFLAAEASAAATAITSADIANGDHQQLALRVRKFLKSTVLQWQAIEPELPLLKTVKIDFVKLFYKLRAHKLSPDVLTSLATVVHYLQRHDYHGATESYYQMSIGNVAWPIGIRDVGIHARSNDDKTTKAMANIMASDTTRRWMVSVKRVITWCETMTK